MSSSVSRLSVAQHPWAVPARQIGFRASGVNGVKEIRAGPAVGIELEVDCAELVGQALEEGLLINVTAGSVVRLLPPLILSEEET